MNWRETVLGFSAMASPEVGGRYHIERPPGYFWIVEHEARERRRPVVPAAYRGSVGDDRGSQGRCRGR